ncbi:MAG TPA: N,N-dimethylformamidase beta subunit family domain-containing protein [Microlunatus sp.]|nr:N,N-dimethylformamidase beta subunit family domain-containing protein [Microlunatus sp.]
MPVVEGFANLASVDPGQRVTLYVSTTAPHWRATAYRMGWYSGHVAAKVWRSPWERRVRQPGPRTSGSTHTPSAPWRASLSVTTTGWRPGTYLIRLDARGGSSYVPLTVRSPSTAGRLVMLTPDTTWQAYNDWGGRNLYWGPAGNGDGAHRARAVTFDRPYAEGHGAGEYLTRMLAVVTLAERLRLPLAYADDVDLQSRPHLLAGAAGVISMGHDEYWSVPMRAALSAARNAGTNVAFLGANAIDRRIRLSSTATGPYRLMVNYKDAREDPLSRSDPKLTTADWSLPPAADPQRTLTGEPYACFPGHGDLVVASPTSWLLAGTGLRPGDRIPGAIGPEFDAVDPRQSMPHPLDVVFHSPVVCRNWRFSDATYYVARSGAGVLDIGTMGWLKALNGGAGVRARSRAVRITSTVLTAFARPRAGLAHPAADSVRRIYRGGR